ncbi:MAG: formate dehydrogenase subunit gamma [Alphaproteobacteria bacterium]
MSNRLGLWPLSPTSLRGCLKHFFRFCALLLMAALMLGAPATPSLSEGGLAPEISTNPGPPNTLGGQSNTDYWRQIRQGKAFTLVNPQMGPPVLVQSEGQIWRVRRDDMVKRYGGYLILAMLAAILLFAFLRGRVRIEGGRSGQTIARFSQAERTIHWFVAALFVMLGFSGLVLLFGRSVLVPVIGKTAFGVLASAMMQGHNLLGPLFIIGIVAMAVVYFKDNLPRSADIAWFLKGGLFFKWHVPSWKYNAGEKIWFWVAVAGGLALSGSGLFLDFPWVAQNLQQLQLANLIHSIAGVVLIAFAIGHIYLGTVGVEGALEGMTSGQVDESWAQEHHHLWADAITGETPADVATPEDGETVAAE